MKRLALITVLSLTMLPWRAIAQPVCPGDLNSDGVVTIDEILGAVNAALNGCPSSSGEWIVEKRVDIPGTVTSIVADTAGRFAYVSTGTALVKLDLSASQATQIVPFQSSYTTATLVDAIDATGALLSVHGFYGAAVIRLLDLVQTGSLSATGVGRTTFANSSWYLPSPNMGVLIVANTDGSGQHTINPRPGTAPGTINAAIPRISAASSDGSRVVFDDEQRGLIHSVDTVTNTLAGTFVVGSQPVAIFVPDSDHAIVVGDGIIARVDLRNPTAIPQFSHVSFLAGQQQDEAFSSRSTVTINRSYTTLVAVKTASSGSGYPTPTPPELGFVTVASGAVSNTMVLDISEAQSRYVLELLPDGQTVLLGAGQSVYFIRSNTPA